MAKVTMVAVAITITANNADKRQCFRNMLSAFTHSGVFSWPCGRTRVTWGEMLGVAGAVAGVSVSPTPRLTPALLKSSKFLLTVDLRYSLNLPAALVFYTAGTGQQVQLRPVN